MQQKLAHHNRPTIHNFIAVILNVLAGTVFGFAFGIFGNMLSWLRFGLVSGLLLGVANEFLFARIKTHPRIYRFRSVLLALVEFLVVMYLGFPAHIAYTLTHPVREPVVGSPMDVGVAYEDVEIPTTGGVTLRGWYVPSSNGAVVLALHGYNTNRVVFLPHARVLAEAGYGVLMLDLRAHGESGGDVFPIANPAPDVRAAIDFLRQRPDVDPGRIGAIGRSVGAGAVVRAAAEGEPIQALWVDGMSMNTYDDHILYASESSMPAPVFWLTIPGYLIYDRMKELMSGGGPIVSNRSLVPRLAPRPIFFVAAGTGRSTF
ncbi:MAG: alpha/beta fold hydrolase [Anaerolineales bacterium]|nr:alpha/beta fold hydrolase [Anaerolineales bacterium]